MKKYDLLVVGSGLFGSVVAYEAARQGKRVLVLEKRNHIGGNCYTEDVSGIAVHKYGAHIFRTDSKRIWEYLCQLCTFNNFINSPVANYKGELYNLPFNMNTFYALWHTRTPQEVHEKIESQRVPLSSPKNLEEHILNSVGRDIYEKLVKGYTEKQWGRPCAELPASLMRRIPLRFTFDNNYFNDFYQGIPKGGYTPIFEKLLKHCEVRLNTDFLQDKAGYLLLAEKTVYTGTIDAYYDYRFGPLEYRSLRFKEEELPLENFQGVAVMNFTDADTPYTRIIEHKHFDSASAATASTVISREFPYGWTPEEDPYYPMEDSENLSRYARYEALTKEEEGVFFGGRLGEYRYYDMQDTIASALEKIEAWSLCQ